jgi:hypothetical protein
MGDDRIMKIQPRNIIGFAMVIAGGLLMAVGLNALFSIGTCASGGPYISANPCPAGTGGHVFELMGGIILATFGIIVSGSFAISFGGFFTGVGAYSLAHVLTTNDLPAGATTAGEIIGVTFLLIGVPALLGGLRSATRSSAGSSSRTPINVGSLAAGANLSAAGAMGGSAFAVAPTIMRVPAATVAKPTGDPLDKLKELADLKDRGVLSDAEFQAQKARLLSS